MEHDIGCKIKAARIEKKLTQEQVAELLGVSRQTISNWENEKSYPDIISVIKMSDCYEHFLMHRHTFMSIVLSLHKGLEVFRRT